jgi:hypothetical protein
VSPVVRVVAERPRSVPGPAVPVRHQLGLSELVAAARLAGDVPLPVPTGSGGPVGDRLAERLAGTPTPEAQHRIDAALRRAADQGPGGARAGLADRGLLVDDRLDDTVAAALQVLAGAPLSVVLDVAVTRRAGTLRLRTWFGAGRGLVSQLATADGLDYELACFDPRLWVSQLTRAVTVEPWVPEPAPLALPDYVSLPSELLAGSEKAHRERRTELLAPMAAGAGEVRLGDASGARPAGAEETLALLRTLGGACRGRLRLLAARRDRPEDPAVTSWLLFDDGWHELRPGRAATSVLRRRDARDLGLVTQPLVDSATAVSR